MKVTTPASRKYSVTTVVIKKIKLKPLKKFTLLVKKVDIKVLGYVPYERN